MSNRSTFTTPYVVTETPTWGYPECGYEDQSAKPKIGDRVRAYKSTPDNDGDLLVVFDGDDEGVSFYVRKSALTPVDEYVAPAPVDEFPCCARRTVEQDPDLISVAAVVAAFTTLGTSPDAIAVAIRVARAIEAGI